jgi:hypothetical protein
MFAQGSGGKGSGAFSGALSRCGDRPGVTESRSRRHVG